MAIVKKSFDKQAEDGFVRQVMQKLNVNEEQASHLVWSSWRKFRLILAQDGKLRSILRDYLDFYDGRKKW